MREDDNVWHGTLDVPIPTQFVRNRLCLFRRHDYYKHSRFAISHIQTEPLQQTESMLFARGSASTSSMLRDMEAGGRVEADHVVGDMLRLARAAGVDARLLAAAYCHLQGYAARRQHGATG